ncbi:hypothetical protein ACFX2H_030290 [Malus domestica]
MDFRNYLGCGGGTKDTGIKLEQGHDLGDDQIELLVFEDAVIVELSFMASFSLPLHSTPIPSRPTSSISPISKTHSQISFIRNPNPCFASKALSNNPQFARRDILIGGLGIYGGSKMSEITGNSGESAATETTPNRVVELSEFSITLDLVISVIVPRPKKSRTKAEKGMEEEVLAI